MCFRSRRSRPNNPRFSSGPLHQASRLVARYAQGRAARPQPSPARDQSEARARAQADEALLKLPAGYVAAIVPASDTGAVEMALWSLLGPRGVDVLAWEAFSRDWVTDIVEQLKTQGRARAARALRRSAGPRPGRFRSRRGVRLERHDLRRARAERRLDRGRPQGAHHLRCDLGGVRAEDRLGEARCRDLLLAEGAGRRGAARHFDPVAARDRSGWRATRRPGRCRSCSA